MIDGGEEIHVPICQILQRFNRLKSFDSSLLKLFGVHFRVNGIRQPDGSIKALTPKQVADLLGHSTSQITEWYYVKKDTARLTGITDDFNI